jgi:hypothetical protein
MSTDRLEIHLPLKKLLIGLFLTLVPLCAVGLYTITKAGSQMRDTIGTHFRTIAGLTASEISMFFNDRVVAVGTLASDPTIVEAVTEANRRYAGVTRESVEAHILKMEKEWNTPAADGYVRQMLTSRAGRQLTGWRQTDRRFLRITLTDAQGAAIAATHKTMDYFQADEDFWQATFAEGRGSIHLTDVLYDDVTKSYYVGLGVPVMEEGTNRFIGAIDALIEVSMIFPLVHRIEVGDTMRAALVKGDGTIIYTPGVSLAAQLKSEEYESVREVLATASGRQRGYLTTRLRSGEDVLVGYADPGLADSHPKLDWKLLVIQDSRHAFAATRGVMRLMWFSVAVGVTLLTLLAVFFSLHRRPDYTDIQMEEEPAVPAAGR